MADPLASSPLLLTNIGELLTLAGGVKPRRGRELLELGIVKDAAVLCLDGRIALAGRRDEVCRSEVMGYFERALIELDCGGGVVLPGFVDSHTHPVFIAPRLVDFEKRIAGAGYEEIAEAGGGIHSSVAAVRGAPAAELANRVESHLNAMLHQGTTTVEAKSGYGLSLESEIESLRSIRSAAGSFPGTVVATLLGAHVVPGEYRARREEYVRVICEEMIPLAAREQLAAFVDVFCERGAFSLDEAESVLRTAGRHSLGARLHIGQFTPSPLERVLALDPASLDHLDYFADPDLDRLARSNAVVTLLPGANYFLGSRFPDARKLIDAGVGVALATDFNPGTSPTWNMSLILSLACTQMKMTPAESIAAATINGAHALRLAHRKGSIEEGKDADLIVFDVQDYREIPYWFGVSRCKHTVARGVMVPARTSLA